MSREEVKKVWADYWARNKGHEVVIDAMSMTIGNELTRHCAPVKDKKILEAGCGRGVISAGLAELGGDVSLLDLSPDAIGIARTHFSARNLHGSFIQGDILAMPFDESSFDVVWNAGVMEHFEGDLQAQAIKNIARTIKPGGLFVTFNPYAKAFFYIAGKKHAEKKGIWPYGPEFPVLSLRDACDGARLTVVSEYVLCFKENLSYLAYVSKHLRSATKFILFPFPKRLLMKIFGGYLLATVAVKGMQDG